MAERLIAVRRGTPEVDVYYDSEKDCFWLGEIAESSGTSELYKTKYTLSDDELWLKLIEWGIERGLEEFLKVRPMPDLRTDCPANTEQALNAALGEMGAAYLPLTGKAAVVVARDGEMVVVITEAEYFTCVAYRGVKRGFSTREEAYAYGLKKVKERRRELLAQQEREAEAEPQTAQKRGLFGKRK